MAQIKNEIETHNCEKIKNRKEEFRLYIIKAEINNVSIAIIKSDEVIIKDVDSALDIMSKVMFEGDCNAMIISKANMAEDFFDLSTRLAGEIIQKFINYQIKVAIVGDFSMYTSKALKDFIYESNQGKYLFFVTNQEEGIEKLS